MLVSITESISHDISAKFDFVSREINSLESFFKKRFYGDDLHTLLIGLTCMSPQFEPFFKVRRPQYIRDAKTIIDHGIQVRIDAMTFGYDLKLDYETVLKSSNIKHLLAQEVLKSLAVIKSDRKIKDFDTDRFSIDFEDFFRQQNWLTR